MSGKTEQVIPEFKCTANRKIPSKCPGHILTEFSFVPFSTESRARGEPEEAKGYKLKVTHAPPQPFPGDTS